MPEQVVELQFRRPFNPCLPTLLLNEWNEDLSCIDSVFHLMFGSPLKRLTLSSPGDGEMTIARVQFGAGGLRSVSFWKSF